MRQRPPYVFTKKQISALLCSTFVTISFEISFMRSYRSVHLKLVSKHDLKKKKMLTIPYHIPY